MDHYDETTTSALVQPIYTCVKEGSMYRLKQDFQNLRAGPVPTQLLKASNDGAVTAETGRQFQRRIVEGKKELP